jgi:WD40 repeat protein
MACLSLTQTSQVPAQPPELRATLKGHTGEVNCVAFSPVGKMLALGCLDNMVKLWEMPASRRADK